ncbi:MAG: acetamidase/formamidase family protein [Chloroflexota bacterium]
MSKHFIEPNETALHGVFSREMQPILTIDPGETVRFKTLDAAWNLEPRASTKYIDFPKQFDHPDREKGHALCGPVFIRGAKPGMTLAVEIGEIVAGGWGFTAVGGWPHIVNDRLGFSDKAGTFLLWTHDIERGLATNQHGQSVELRPFMGVMGMPQDVAGEQSTIPPRITGGNIDCKELVAGSTLYLPIEVEGGLFSTGDGHGRQGDGESSVTAIECPIERVDLTFNLEPDMPLKTPLANTPAGWITFGFDESLDEAVLIALEAMVDFMHGHFGVDRHHALGLISVTVDLRITQIVNQVKGVHAVLSHEVIAELGL